MIIIPSCMDSHSYGFKIVKSVCIWGLTLLVPFLNIFTIYCSISARFVSEYFVSPYRDGLRFTRFIQKKNCDNL